MWRRPGGGQCSVSGTMTEVPIHHPPHASPGAPGPAHTHTPKTHPFKLDADWQGSTEKYPSIYRINFIFVCGLLIIL